MIALVTTDYTDSAPIPWRKASGTTAAYWSARTASLLLIGPDDEPDIEPHDDAEPHADADQTVTAGGTFGQAQRQRFDDIAVHRPDRETGYDRRHRGPTEPEQCRRCDNLADGRFLVVGYFAHIGDLNEVEIPQDADPHDPGQHMRPAPQELPECIAFKVAIAVIHDEQKDHEDEPRHDRSCQIRQYCTHFHLTLC